MNILDEDNLVYRLRSIPSQQCKKCAWVELGSHSMYSAQVLSALRVSVLHN